MRIPHNKIHWTDDQVSFLKEKHSCMTNQDIANALNMKVTAVRHKLYSMGMYKMKLEYWTDEQVEYLKANFQIIGDSELAAIFNSKWHKKKGWSKKHIEKKRLYLKLVRTEEQKKAIHQRNVNNGNFALCPVKAWKKRGVSPNGTVRFWRQASTGRKIPYIKIEGRYHHWSRWFWEQNNGPIPEGCFVLFKDDPSILTIDNLYLVHVDDYRNSVGRNSTGLTDNYVAAMLSYGNPELRAHIKENKELIQAKRTQLLIDRKIKSLQNGKK